MTQMDFLPAKERLNAIHSGIPVTKDKVDVFTSAGLLSSPAPVVN
jgi:hypothetical protein